MTQHLMIDLETLSTVPGGIILSIGAVLFTADGVSDRTFYTNINVTNSESHGFLTDADTLKWWEAQSDEAKSAVLSAFTMESPTVREALDEFGMFIKQNVEDVKQLQVWSYGANFDISFLEVYFARLDRKVPWHYRNARCHRTLKALVSESVFEGIKREGEKHNALHDAIFQAKEASAALRYLGNITNNIF